jgi:NAD(P)-dependent dehydrogenase (short-subunit alcohol dehydrogenase family)
MAFIADAWSTSSPGGTSAAACSAVRCIVASVSPSGRLEGKVAVVTGATSGFGEAIARLFAAEGASLVLSGRRADAGEALVEELADVGAVARFYAGDVGDEATATGLALCTRDVFGRVDVAVLNAGIGSPGLGPFWEVEPADFDLVFWTNVRGVFLGARALTPLMGAGGSIVVMASMSSFIVNEDETVYSASKGAVLQLARGMAADLAVRGVRVNALCPGVCDTPMTRSWIDSQADRGAAEAEAHAFALVGRMGTAEEIARAALFLACDESSYCTGASLIADGGVTIR